jgi:hypothetical protein
MESKNYGLKYGTYKIFDTFWLINIDEDEYRTKNTPLMTKSFLSLVVLEEKQVFLIGFYD